MWALSHHITVSTKLVKWTITQVQTQKVIQYSIKTRPKLNSESLEISSAKF